MYINVYIHTYNIYTHICINMSPAAAKGHPVPAAGKSRVFFTKFCRCDRGGRGSTCTCARSMYEAFSC